MIHILQIRKLRLGSVTYAKSHIKKAPESELEPSTSQSTYI